ncbi:MAG TPA: DEAD/DEAH box helicase family protein [Bacteroidales bacterium]|nr:DEAD/DEAH box helicase family protein [Bacteroidales bacterium]
MKEFPKDIKFKYNWRKYQQRVLDELHSHLFDNNLHIIAPPGSGKTVLGLEVMLRLNKPTLILAPTIAIKNQWIQRFCELFLQSENVPDWISGNLKEPKFLTVSTYQALHSSCSNSDIDEEREPDNDECVEDSAEYESSEIDSETVLRLLRDQNVGTIIVDEAHHLKNEWWRSLIEIKHNLKPTIVGLTATPPYDVPFTEWQRYIELNGPVDAEISVPELVSENDLCPHQDFIFLSEPTENESRLIYDQRQRTAHLFEEIKRDGTLISALMNHPIYTSPENNLEWIYDNLEYYSSVLIFLKANDRLVTEKHIEIVGTKDLIIPPLSYEWLETLLTFYLFVDEEKSVENESHKEKLINKLKRAGVLERKTICFTYNSTINKALSTSAGKLKSIDQIVDIENNTLKDDLRMVILTDYIRKEYLTNSGENGSELNKIGVFPIFEQLRRTNDRNLKLCILSGSLVVIPKTSLKSLRDFSGKSDPDAISFTVLPSDDQYLIIDIAEKFKQDSVRLITHLFEKGEFHILIGTKSLLGEGWDAPFINSLILASFVGSYVQSNQMRGRAIRSCGSNPDKTSNIWHLVCIDKSIEDSGEDIRLLKRRFKGFIGISFNHTNSIENGIERMNLPERFSSTDEIEKFNSMMIGSSGQRSFLKQKWNDALENGMSMIEEIKIPFPVDKEYQKIKSAYFNKTIASTAAFLGSGLITFSEDVIKGLVKSLRSMRSRDDIFRYLMIMGSIGLAIFGKEIFRTCRLYIRYRDISKDFQKIGEALLITLARTGDVETEYSKMKVVSSVSENGIVCCHLEGGTRHECSMFLKSLHEITGVITNPRYIIVRKSLFAKLIFQKDYHSVPELIGQNKRNAEYFEEQWKKLVGNCNLIYTRTPVGRKLLLKSRINSLSSEFVDKTEIINIWK